MDTLENLVAQATLEFAQATDAPQLENAKARYLGKSGAITEQLKGLAKLDAEQKKAEGARINKAKNAIEAALEARRDALRQAQSQANAQRAGVAQVQQQIQVLAAEQRHIEEQSRQLQQRHERLRGDRNALATPDEARLAVLQEQLAEATDVAEQAQARLHAL